MPKKGETVPQEMRDRIAAALRGRKASAETKAKLSATWHDRFPPEKLAARSDRIRAAYKAVEVRKRVADSTRKALRRPDVRARHLAAIAAVSVPGSKKWRESLSHDELGQRMAAARAGQRGGQTSIERAVQDMLDDAGIEYVAQYPIGRYRADFYLPLLNYIIECDGTYWHGDYFERDQQRDAQILEAGYNIIRLPEDYIKSGAARQLLTSMLARGGRDRLPLRRSAGAWRA